MPAPLVPQAVFIDTSVFRAAQFNFKARQFASLLAAIPTDTRLKLLVPEPIAREVDRQMATSASEAVHALRKLRQGHSILHKGLELPHDEVTDSALARALQSKVRAEWTAFKKKFETHELGYDGVDLREIMGWYFRQTPPFGAGDKRKEFPDAIAFSLVRDFAALTHESVAVISKDNDFRDACERVSGLFSFPEVSDFTNLLLKQRDRFADAERIVAEMRLAIVEKIKEEFGDRAFDHECDPNGRGSVENIAVANVEIAGDGLTIVGLGHRKIDVQFTATVAYEADVEYDDPDSWISGDPGDDVFYLHSCEGRVTDETEINGTARIKVSENWESPALSALEIDEDTVEVSAEAPQKDDHDEGDFIPPEPDSSS